MRQLTKGLRIPMRNDLDRLRTLVREGKCCSVALMQLGLEIRGEKNDQLLQVVSALCGGIKGGLACGALTGAACMMNVLDPIRANDAMVPELTEWFKETMGSEYGGTDCLDIVHDDPMQKRAICPGLVEKVYLQAKEIMQAYGYEFD
jgi:hypothetical protein